MLKATRGTTLRAFTAIDTITIYRIGALAAGIAGAYYFLGIVGGVVASDLRNACNTIAQASATLLGFLVSAGALLYAVANTRLVRNLYRTQHFQRLLADLFVDAAAFLLALTISLICLFLGDGLLPARELTYLQVGAAGMVLANIVAYLLLLPVGQKMWIVLSNLAPESDALE